MSSQMDAQYFTRRAEQERALAQAARDFAIRRIHLDLAARYAERLEQVQAVTPRQSMR
jgi:hypothetical protein